MDAAFAFAGTHIDRFYSREANRRLGDVLEYPEERRMRT